MIRVMENLSLCFIIDDAEERYNLADEYPEIVGMLQDKLLKYMSEESLPLKPNDDPNIMRLKRESEILPQGWCSREYLEQYRRVSLSCHSLPRHFYN